MYYYICCLVLESIMYALLVVSLDNEFITSSVSYNSAFLHT